MQNPFQNIAHLLGRKKIQTILRILNDHISKGKKRKNRKIDFTFVSEHCATFGPKKSAIFEGGGWER